MEFKFHNFMTDLKVDGRLPESPSMPTPSAKPLRVNIVFRSPSLLVTVLLPRLRRHVGVSRALDPADRLLLRGGILVE